MVTEGTTIDLIHMSSEEPPLDMITVVFYGPYSCLTKQARVDLENALAPGRMVSATSHSRKPSQMIPPRAI